jgi:hypothetical protein
MELDYKESCLRPAIDTLGFAVVNWIMGHGSAKFAVSSHHIIIFLAIDLIIRNLSNFEWYSSRFGREWKEDLLILSSFFIISSLSDALFYHRHLEGALVNNALKTLGGGLGIAVAYVPKYFYKQKK